MLNIFYTAWYYIHLNNILKAVGKVPDSILHHALEAAGAHRIVRSHAGVKDKGQVVAVLRHVDVTEANIFTCLFLFQAFACWKKT